MSKSIVCQLLYYITFILLGWLVAILLFQAGIISIGSIILPNVMAIIFFQLILVSVSETLVFHVIIPMKLRAFFKDKLKPRGSTFLTYVLSQGVFSLFHAPAFNYQPLPLLLAFLWGLSFLAITDYYGASSTMGFHFGVNMVLSGILSGGIISGGLLTFNIEPVAIFLLMGMALILSFYFIQLNYHFPKTKSGIPSRAINPKWTGGKSILKLRNNRRFTNG